MFSGGDVVGWDRNLLEGLGVRQEVARHAQNNDKLRRVLESRGLTLFRHAFIQPR